MSEAPLGHPKFDGVLVNKAEVNGIDLSFEYLLAIHIDFDKMVCKRDGQAMPFVVGNLNRKCLDVRSCIINIVNLQLVFPTVALHFK